MSKQAKFLIMDFTGKEGTECDIRIVGIGELFETLDAARSDASIEISVYEIGDCLLDWS